MARQIALIGERYFGVDIKVVNKVGGEGAVAMAHVREQPADGYYIGTFTISQAVAMAAGGVPFTPRDILPLIKVQNDPYVIVTRVEEPFNNLIELFAYAKANPGKLTAGGYGVATAHSLAFQRLLRKAGDPDIRWIPYEGTAPAVIAALGGHVTVANANWGVVSEHVRAGTMKVLGISTTERIDPAPDVPTYTEQGFPLVLSHWRGFYVHPDTPEDVVTEILRLFRQTIHDPEFGEFMALEGQEYADIFETSAEFAEWYVSEVEEFRVLLREMGLI
jgi:tripartite-type tricarboxylate transporter receptor subunit TctC